MIIRLAEAPLHTRFGTFLEMLYYDGQHESIAIVMGEVRQRDNVLCRLHSHCVSAHLFNSILIVRILWVELITLVDESNNILATTIKLDVLRGLLLDEGVCESLRRSAETIGVPAIRTTTSAILARTKTPTEGVAEIESRLSRVMR